MKNNKILAIIALVFTSLFSLNSYAYCVYRTSIHNTLTDHPMHVLYHDMNKQAHDEIIPAESTTVFSREDQCFEHGDFTVFVPSLGFDPRFVSFNGHATDHEQHYVCQLQHNVTMCKIEW